MRKLSIISKKKCRGMLSFILLVLGTTTLVIAQPARTANKFLGNITTSFQVRSDFLQYWDQITGENEHKWASVEGTRNQMNWTSGDRIATFARNNNIPWRFHTLIWGAQAPGWMSGLSQADQLAEIRQWMDAAAARYPDVQMIDVVNEGHPNHQPPAWKNALGGDGATGYDWIITAFRMARERWPNAILKYNDYNIVEWDYAVTWAVNMINTIRAAGAPIDAIGIQSHDVFRINSTALRNNINRLAATGLPIYVTEYDVPNNDDNAQLNIVREQFPILWNHPKIVGITYWGYILGSTWVEGTGLKHADGRERPALTWMMNYVRDNQNPPNDFPNLHNRGAATRFALEVSVNGLGSVSRSPNEANYARDSSVILTATPATGFVFDRWLGDATGTTSTATVTMNTNKIVTAVFRAADGKQDLIRNGTFAGIVEPWALNVWGGAATGSVVQGEYAVNITTAGTQSWDIQLIQPGVNIERGKTYRVSFDAYAASNRSIESNVELHVEPWTSYLPGLQTFNLTTTKRNYSFVFRMDHPTDTNARLSFNLGTASQSVTLDNVSVVETAPETPLPIDIVGNSANIGMFVRTENSVIFADIMALRSGNVAVQVLDLSGRVVDESLREAFAGERMEFRFDIKNKSTGVHLVRVLEKGMKQRSTMVVMAK